MKKQIISTYIDKIISGYKPLYLEIPKFKNNERFEVDEKVFCWPRFNNYKQLNKDKLKIIKIYEKYLLILTKYLNKKHKTKYSIDFWRILLTPWLINIITIIYLKFNLAKLITKKEKKLYFFKHQVRYEDTIPHGIEDFFYYMNSNFWNHYIDCEIYKHFPKNIKIINLKKKLDLSSKKEIYKRLKFNSFNLKIYAFILKLLSKINISPKYQIFNTYMSNINEFFLNFRLNKSILISKMVRPYFIYNDILLNKQKKRKKIINSSNKFEDILKNQILNNIPFFYLEDFNHLNKKLANLPYAKKPKVIFTTLGINRSTITDLYLANKIFFYGSKLYLAQHGGNYFQEKNHFYTMYERKISHKYFTWGNKKNKKDIRLGIIKDFVSKTQKSKKIIVEWRSLPIFNSRIRCDSGVNNTYNYNISIINFLKSISKDDYFSNIFLKLQSTNYGWNEKKVILKSFKKISFLDSNLKTINLIKSSKMVIYTHPSTGHLECAALNHPFLLLYLNDFHALEKKTQTFFNELKKVGLLHTNIESLVQKVRETNDDKKLNMWWTSKVIQNILKRYRYNYAFFNRNKLSKIIKELKY